MIKYVFKDNIHEKAVRNFCEQIGVLEVDEQVKESLDDKLPYVSFYRKGETQPIFTLSADNFESVEVYDPNGWNDRTVIPPQVIAGLRYSDPYLVENAMGYYVAAIFDFRQNAWVDNRDLSIVTCSRYREVPNGFFGE